MNPGDVLPSVEKSITQERIERYAEAAGDFNPIHVDEEFAAQSQFGGRIAHGMMIAAIISEMMTAAFGQAWHESGRMKIRFRSPVFPGDRIEATGAVESVRPCDDRVEIVCTVQVTKDSGETAISGDAAVVAPAD